VGLSSGQYGGKNSTMMFLLSLAKYFVITEDLWYGALSNMNTYFPFESCSVKLLRNAL